MKFVPMRDLLSEAYKKGYAVPSFCVWNSDILLAVLQTAQELRSPVIIMNGVPEHGLLPMRAFADMARGLAGPYSVRAALHLDHGPSMDHVRAAIDAGYTSVMLDYSSRPFAENASALRQAVALAHAKGITVEGEIGHVGQADTITAEQTGDSTLTRPEEAAEFARVTGIDALAVSIGNAHGNYTKLPRLDIARLEIIREQVDIPLVLHGGSGTPEEDLKRIIKLGMAKINIATDLVTAWRGSLLDQWNQQKNLWAPVALAEARKAIVPVIERWIRLADAAERA